MPEGPQACVWRAEICASFGSAGVNPLRLRRIYPRLSLCRCGLGVNLSRLCRIYPGLSLFRCGLGVNLRNLGGFTPAEPKRQVHRPSMERLGSGSAPGLS